MTDYEDEQPAQTVLFGRWMLTQRDRNNWVDGIADAACADPTFPKNGELKAIRAHLHSQQADGMPSLRSTTRRANG
ncbi:hypothetical protein [Sphingomonas sp. GC_Shp_3]|uniref:hypothetical protein n=1 Tax=Sphingomonas sp. GC_Shp_3 TaxID=2937383 RepID=UPI00226A59E4|nr:hypothetical protein [Sphingomonas sp. GC_Shp_3]